MLEQKNPPILPLFVKVALLIEGSSVVTFMLVYHWLVLLEMGEMEMKIEIEIEMGIERKFISSNIHRKVTIG